MQTSKKYWFPAKTHGWGWGLPRVWQGWVVMAIFALLMTGGGVFLFPLGADTFVAYSVLMSMGFVAVCWLKGESPHWRWGDK